MNAALMDRIRALAGARRMLAEEQAALAMRQAQFETETRSIRLAVNLAKDAVAAAELTVRTLAVEAYQLTGAKKPAPGTEIKLRATYAINAAAGLAWAKEKGLCLIPESLDLDAVKKMAAVTPLPFVLVDHEPQAQIASDLDAALEKIAAEWQTPKDVPPDVLAAAARALAPDAFLVADDVLLATARRIAEQDGAL